MQEQIPVVYFLGTSPGRYQPIIPTFIVGWHPERLRVQLAFGALVGASAQAVPPDAPERRYALREVKARLHQASFRDALLAAYGGRCAISHIPEPRLLDAAHIIMDADEQLAQPVVSNGLPLTKLHHAAFDANQMGVERRVVELRQRQAIRDDRVTKLLVRIHDDVSGIEQTRLGYMGNRAPSPISRKDGISE